MSTSKFRALFDNAKEVEVRDYSSSSKIIEGSQFRVSSREAKIVLVSKVVTSKYQDKKGNYPLMLMICIQDSSMKKRKLGKWRYIRIDKTCKWADEGQHVDISKVTFFQRVYPDGVPFQVCGFNAKAIESEEDSEKSLPWEDLPY